MCQGASAAETSPRPKVRAITAFIRLDRSRYEAQIRETLKTLREAKAVFERGGYEVESVRITTQPFPEYIHGLSKQEALDFFRAYDALAAKENFDANIGPAMLRDNDDTGPVELLGTFSPLQKRSRPACMWRAKTAFIGTVFAPRPGL